MEYNNIIDFNKYDFSTTPVIKPPTQQERDNFTNNSLITQKLIMIDSRDRNTNLYKNNNDFIIELDEPIDDVYEVELVSANMPINSYNINEHNNRLYFFVNSVSDFSKTYDHIDNDLYNSDGTIKKDKIFYIKMIPNNYPNSKSITDYLRFNNHYVYSLDNNQRTGKIAAFFISYNNLSSKYNILIFTGGNYGTGGVISDYICHNDFTTDPALTTADAIKNSIIFRGDKITYNSKTMYNYLPNSAHEIFGFDLNYGFINTEYNDSKLSKALHDYILYLEPQNVTDFGAFDYDNYYNAPYNIYSQNAGDVIRTVNGVTATLDIDIYNSINISNTMATNKVNEYVLLHLPSLPTMANKIASNNIVQNAYTKLHLGTGSTRNVFLVELKHLLMYIC